MSTIIKGTESIRKRYRQDVIANEYERARFSSFLGKLTHDMELEAIKSALEQIHPSKLLEIAVGPGRISKNLDFFDMAVGIDTSNPMLKIAKKNVENQRWNFLNADAMNMPFCSESFDAIVTFRLIRHFTKEERARAYRGVYRVLKKDGILIMDALNDETGIITKTFDNVYRTVARLITGKKDDTIYDVKYQKRELEKELMEARLQLKSITGIIHGYNLYFPLNLPFEVLRYAKKDKCSLYKIALGRLLSLAIKIEHHRTKKNETNGHSWVIVCVKK
jgi:ubiquinone/menaquinone biosynthesis C-methylase UbiE